MVPCLDGDGGAETRAEDATPAPGSMSEHAHSTSSTCVRRSDGGGLDRNNFRSAEQFTLGQGFNADAIVQVVGTCNDFCASGVQKILVRIANRGTASLPADLSVGILAPQTNGQVRLIDVLKTSTAIAPGAVTAGLSFSIDLEDMPLRELRVVVDQEQTLPECDETNNQAIIVDDLCP